MSYKTINVRTCDWCQKPIKHNGIPRGDFHAHIEFSDHTKFLDFCSWNCIANHMEAFELPRDGTKLSSVLPE